jgi:hypothetical protein
VNSSKDSLVHSQDNTSHPVNYMEVNSIRTLDSYDSNAPPALMSGGAATSERSNQGDLLFLFSFLFFFLSFSSGISKVDSMDNSIMGDGIASYGSAEIVIDDPAYQHDKEIAQLFYDAGSCGKTEARIVLENLAMNSNDLLARGFLMGMLCYGSGMAKDMKRANEIAKVIYPAILEAADDESNTSRKFYQYIAGLCYEQGLVLSFLAPVLCLIPFFSFRFFLRFSFSLLRRSRNREE